MVTRYDTDCIPSNYADDQLGYIQNPDTNKTCYRDISVSCALFLNICGGTLLFIPLTILTGFFLQFSNFTDWVLTCTCYFQIQKQMKSPIYIYYELDNFYQNHRRYV